MNRSIRTRFFLLLAALAPVSNTPWLCCRRLVLLGPFVYFLRGLALAPSIVKDGTTDYTRSRQRHRRIASRSRPNRETVMVKNENYWVTGRPYLDGLAECLGERDRADERAARRPGRRDRRTRPDDREDARRDPNGYVYGLFT